MISHCMPSCPLVSRVSMLVAPSLTMVVFMLILQRIIAEGGDHQLFWKRHMGLVITWDSVRLTTLGGGALPT